MFLSPGIYVEDIIAIGEMERYRITMERERQPSVTVITGKMAPTRLINERERQPSFTEADEASLCSRIHATLRKWLCSKCARSMFKILQNRNNIYFTPLVPEGAKRHLFSKFDFFTVHC